MKSLLSNTLMLGLVAACGTMPEEKQPAETPPSDTVVEKLTGPVEELTCFSGIRDQHARIGVRVVGEKVDYFAFYSKRKPRTCSIDVGRDGRNGRWEDNGTYSKVTLAGNSGILLIHRASESYRFDFRDVDRMKYCGMDGKINGSITVKRGESECFATGIINGH